MNTKPKKKIYWIFLIIWSVVLCLVLAGALVWFYGFLKNYQKVYDETRPKLFMDRTLELFTGKDVDGILQVSKPVELGPLEGEEQLKAYLRERLDGKVISYGTKAGEHIEERPVYVVTADEEPVAVVRLKKQAESAEYGLPLWELNNMELLVTPGKERVLSAPSTVTVLVNGRELTEDMIVEEGIADERAAHFNGYAEIPTYTRYKLGSFLCEPVVEATNFAGEAVEAEYDSGKYAYKVDFGGDSELQEGVEEFAVQAVMDYANYVSNDAPYGALDKYFPAGSELLTGIKKNQREWFDYHLTPEIKNQKMTSFTAFTEDAFSARVYLEQYMYVPFSKKTEMLVTDLDVYFVNQNGFWKIAGIAFE